MFPRPKTLAGEAASYQIKSSPEGLEAISVVVAVPQTPIGEAASGAKGDFAIETSSAKGA